MWLSILVWLIQHAGAVCQPVIAGEAVVLFIGPSDREINCATRDWVNQLDQPSPRP